MFQFAQGRMGLLGGQKFNPASLFTGGVQGAWYDPSDINLNWRRNLLTYTEQFDNAAWTTVSINAFGSGSVANTTATLDPIGGNTADYIQENNTNNAHGITAGILVVVGQTYTASVYAKKAQRNWLRLFFGGQPDTWFDLNNGVRGTVGAGVTASITDVGNGWYRCAITSTASLTGSLGIRISDANGVTAYLGTGTDGIFIWGAQLELGSTASAYQQIVTPEITYVQTIQSQPVLFTDSAGTTPVTAVEQAVGLMLDKSKGGVGTNGAYRYNLLNYTENFANTYWISGGTVNVNSNSTIAPNDTLTADTLTALNADSFIYSTGQTFTAGASYVASVYLRANTPVSISLYVNRGDGTFAGSTVNVTTTWQRFFVSFVGASGANGYFQIGGASAFSTGETVFAWGAQISLSTAPTAYQRVDATWYDAIPGNHAYQSTSTARPILRARYNLLTYSEQFDNGVWDAATYGASVSANTTTAPDGSLAADTLTENTANSTHLIRTTAGTFAYILGVSYTQSWYVKSNGRNKVAIYFPDIAFPGTARSATYDLVSETATANGASGTASIQRVGSGWFRCVYTQTADASASDYSALFALLDASGNLTYTGDGTSGVYIWGAQLIVTNSLTSNQYQRIAAATDYNTSGFLPYLSFDGTDDSMLTNSVNPGAVDKAQVFAGVRKLSNAATNIVVELSADRNANNGAFTVTAPTLTDNNYSFVSKGTLADTAASAASSYAAPITNVVTGVGDISGDAVTLRVNGTQIATGTSDQGTGNYLTYPLYIGARGGTSLWFNGWMTSLIVRFGPNLSAAQISATEAWVNSKTGAY